MSKPKSHSTSTRYSLRSYLSPVSASRMLVISSTSVIQRLSVLRLPLTMSEMLHPSFLACPLSQPFFARVHPDWHAQRPLEPPKLCC